MLASTLLEIKAEGDHLGPGTVQGVGVLYQGGIDEVATILLEEVGKSEAELDLGDELEVAQIHVAAHTYLQTAVHGIHAKGMVLACGKVDAWGYAGHEIGTEIVVARRCKLQVEGKGYLCALDDCSGVATAYLLMKPSTLLAKVKGGGETQGEVLVETQFGQHTYVEARAIVVDVAVPLLAGLGIDMAVVGELEVLHMEAQEKTIVKVTHVEVGAVHHTTLLRHTRECGEQHDEYEQSFSHLSTCLFFLSFFYFVAYVQQGTLGGCLFAYWASLPL